MYGIPRRIFPKVTQVTIVTQYLLPPISSSLSSLVTLMKQNYMSELLNRNQWAGLFPFVVILCVLPQRGHYNGIRVGSAKNYGKETYERKEKRTDH